MSAAGLRFFAADLGAWTAGAALVAPLFLVLHAWLLRRDWISAPWTALAAGGLLSLAGYLSFWAYFLRPATGRWFAAALLAGGAAALAGRWRVLLAQWRRSEAAAVVALMALVGLFDLAALDLYAPVPPNLSFYDRAANRFDSRLPADNAIPQAFADALARGPAPRLLVGDWLSSDRPPLQTGWILLTRSPMVGLGWDPQEAGGTASVWLQLFWVAALYGLARTCGARRATALALAAALAPSGFFLQHSVFTWPKLAAGAFALGAAIWLAFEPPAAGLGGRFALAGLLGALAWLAHTGISFGLIALAPWVVAGWRRAPLRCWAAAAAAFLAPILPWIAYQRWYAPPGDRLLKWHLAGQVAIDSRGFWAALRANYAQLGWKGALHNRLGDLNWIFFYGWQDWLRPGRRPVSDYRIYEFFMTFRAANFWILGLAAWLFLAGRRPRAEWTAPASSLGLWLLATLGVWVALMFGEHATILHQGSFTVPLLLFFLLAWALRRLGAKAFGLVLAVQTASFVGVWLGPSDASRGPFDLAAGVALALSAGALLVFVGRDLLCPDSP